MSLYYISEAGTVNSNYLMAGNWSHDQEFGDYSTALDTRSLSISLFPVADNLSSLSLDEKSTTNVALLFYENPNGKVSALLHRLMNTFIEKPSAIGNSEDQWINITSQESKALPNEFRNAPGFNYNNTIYEYNTTLSRTLYDADPIAAYSTPFFSANVPGPGGFVSATFYSPFNLPLNATSPVAGDTFLGINYGIGLTGSGNFSPVGMNYATPCTERFCEMIIILACTLPSKDYVSIHQSDIAGFGSNLQYTLWINGTQPALIQLRSAGSTALPNNKFPFKRLASVTLTDGSMTYLYHQMDGTTFAEEQWDDSLQAWVGTENITVSDS